MSRLIIKNLPKKISSERLKALFSSKGEVTDIQLKFTPDGTFRQFAFIGFKNDGTAQEAKEFFHNTYIDSQKIQVETCETLGNSSIRPWSKHAKSSGQKLPSIRKEKEGRKTKQQSPKDPTPENLKNDQKFAEFLSLHKKGKTTWEDTAIEAGTELLATEETLDSEGEEGNQSDELEKTPLEANRKQPTKQVPQFDDSCTVKLKDLPSKCKKSQIKKFFAPLKIVSLRLPRSIKGLAYVKFKTERDMKQALNKHRGFIEGTRVSVLKYAQQQPENHMKEMINSHEDLETNPLIETGRIFVRNLCYSTTEEDLENLFKAFGPVTEVHLPLDQFTRKLKGFAFVMFMFPEHAVKAFSKLDGTSFQGRTMHLLPAKAKKQTENVEEDSSFKMKKENKLKASSGSWHNWNSLFLGPNAVAEVMAKKYNTSKAKLLDIDSKSSVAVTMALGETQIVSETREFLISEGVHLEAFQNPQTERSKTIILIKNLPANTTIQQLREVFSKHGEMSRLVLPPSGVTAIVEYQHPTEAKLAFRKLAYSKFQHLPLYLEWAPVNSLGRPPASQDSNKEKKESAKTTKEEVLEESKEEDVTKAAEDEQEEEPETGTVLFVKNLNFETREQALQTHFEKCGRVLSATVAKKPDPKNPGQQLSMGYGFVQFRKKKYASKALKELQNSTLDEHALELKMSNRDSLIPAGHRKLTKPGEQKSTKILVRNIPFEATKKEIREIFSVFGELRAVRLPSKITGEHRGFGFVDFLTRHDAKRAMTSLGASTHVFGRRLVLEWAQAEDDNDLDVLRKKTAKHYDAQQPGGAGRKRLRDWLPQDQDDLSS